MARLAGKQTPLTRAPDEGPRGAAPAPSPKSAHDAASFDLDRHLFYWFTKVLTRRDKLLAAGLKPFGLRAAEWRVLAGLRGRQRCSMGELADMSSLDQATLSRTVDRMVEAGWVLRLSDEDDMRVKRLALTPAGHALFEEIWPIVDRLNGATVAALPPGAAELMCAAMRVMCDSLDASLDTEKSTGRAPRGAA
ncbi:MAG: MarR family winged helix-turn-helix transcriptional regulator [Candidatus Eiseniibacteriota bacterium]